MELFITTTEDLKEQLGFEHEVRHDGQDNVTITCKSLTDNSLVYNVYLHNDKGQIVADFSPPTLLAAQSIMDFLIDNDLNTCV